MDYGFEYIISTGGINSEEAYPYISGTGKTETCKRDLEQVKVSQIVSFTDVPKNDEEELMLAVTKQPVSIAIEADKAVFQSYKGGVLNSTACGTHLDHGVLAVGFTEDYWIVKNSWGATWGESGYIRMATGVGAEGMCGIAMQPSYPTQGTDPKTTASTSTSSTPAPGPGSKVYEDPKDGCSTGEKAIQVSGISGDFCAPACSAVGACPDAPAGVDGQAQCVLQSPTGDRYCAILCNTGGCEPSADMTCKPIQGLGICTYDD